MRIVAPLYRLFILPGLRFVAVILSLAVLLWVAMNWLDLLVMASKNHGKNVFTLGKITISGDAKQSRVVLGSEELKQNAGPGSASKRHVKFERINGSWWVSNISTSRSLGLEYSDGVYHLSLLQYLKVGDEFGAVAPLSQASDAYWPSYIEKIKLFSQFGAVARLTQLAEVIWSLYVKRTKPFIRITGISDLSSLGDSSGQQTGLSLRSNVRTIEFSVYEKSVVTARYRAQHSMWGTRLERIDGIPLDENCGGSTGWAPAFLTDAIERIKQQGRVSVLRIGGTVTCVVNKLAAIRLGDTQFDALKVIYVNGRGFAIQAGHSPFAFHRAAGFDSKPSILTKTAHPVVRNDMNGAAISLSGVIIGRTFYKVSLEDGRGSAGDLVLTPAVNPHRIQNCQQQSAGQPFRSTCIRAELAGDFWKAQWESPNIPALGLLLSASAILTLFLLGLWWLLSFPAAAIRSPDPVLAVLQSFFFASTLALLLPKFAPIGVQMVRLLGLPSGLRSMDPVFEPAVAVASNPLPAITAWCCAGLVILISPTAGSLTRLFFIAVTGLIATGNFAAAKLGFASPDMRFSRFYEDSLLAIQLGAVALGFVGWVPLFQLRNFVARFSPTQTADKIKVSPLVILQSKKRIARYSIWLPVLVLITLIDLIRQHGGRFLRLHARNLSTQKPQEPKFFRLVRNQTKQLVFSVVPVSLMPALTWIFSRAGYLVLLLAQYTLAIFKALIGFLLGSPMSGLLFLVLALSLMAWIVLGAEEGIVGLFQPSEVIKALLAIIVAVLVVTVQRRDLGVRARIKPSDAFIQILLVAGLLMIVLAVPVVKSDHSPFLILILMMLTSLSAMVFFHLAMIFIDRVTRWRQFGLREPAFRRRPLLHKTRRVGKQFLNQHVRPFPIIRPIEFVVILVLPVFSILSASWFISVTDDPKWWGIAFEEKMTGTFRTPMLRLRSWTELMLPHVAESNQPRVMSRPPIEIEYPDTGRQVMLSRRAISASPCLTKLIRSKAVTWPSELLDADSPTSFKSNLERGERKIVTFWNRHTEFLCHPNNNSQQDAEEIAVTIPAIHNDFASTWLYVALGQGRSPDCSHTSDYYYLSDVANRNGGGDAPRWH